MDMNNVSIYYILSFILFTAPLQFNAQNTLIKGKIIDKHDRAAIPFAHVFIKGTSLGAITDLYGNFILSYPEEYQAGTLQISCLGYKPVQLVLKSVTQFPKEITLEQDMIRLQEVIVTPEDPVELLKEAFRRIPENHDTTALKLSGYYKMSSMLGEKTTRYTEAFLDIHKPSWETVRRSKKLPGDSIHLREIRTKASEISDWKLKTMIDWESNLYYLNGRDIVKEFGFMKDPAKSFFPRFQLHLEKMVWINGRKTYKIHIKPKKITRKTFWHGNIFLDEATKAFVKLDYKSPPNQLKMMKAEFGYKVLSKLYNVSYQSALWNESVNYEQLDGKWYLEEVQASKEFLITSKKRGLEKVPGYVSLYYSTDSVQSNVGNIDSLEILPYLNKGWWFVEQFIRDRYDSSFWRSFDQRRGVFEKGEFGRASEANHPKQGYAFTKLDTLQGALSPLRTCYDVGFYHLDVEVLPREEIIKGSSLIRFNVTDPTHRLQVDLYSGMLIDSIIYRGKRLPYERDYNAVYIKFPGLLQQGSIEEIKFYFSGRPVDINPRVPLYAAFIWLTDEEDSPFLQAICQGYGASGWWPNKDHLSDEPDSAAISITVPTELDVVANGRLRHKTMLENGKTRYDWFVSYPINNYNLTLNVGKYAHFSDRYVSGMDTLDLDYHVLRYNLENARKKVAMVKPMLKTYEKYFGKYPFPRDGFKLVETPHAMEHQSCVSLGYEYFSEPYEYDAETLEYDLQNGQVEGQIVLHETAHEWWGNSLSCTDNAELWIHEAFATYAEALYIEDHHGYANSQLYLNAMKDGVRNVDPIIGRFNVNHIHYDINDMYLKGALMLNTLRHVIGNDSLWFSIIKGIPSAFKYQSVTTGDLVGYVNQATGVDYGGFFHQYLRTTQVPKLELVFEQVEGRAYVNYRWNAETQDFKMPVKYSLGSRSPSFLFPTPTWQRLKLPLNAVKSDFEVNMEQFYIEVEVKNSK